MSVFFVIICKESSRTTYNLLFCKEKLIIAYGDGGVLPTNDTQHRHAGIHLGALLSTEGGVHKYITKRKTIGNKSPEGCTNSNRWHRHRKMASPLLIAWKAIHPQPRSTALQHLVRRLHIVHGRCPRLLIV